MLISPIFKIKVHYFKNNACLFKKDAYICIRNKGESRSPNQVGKQKLAKMKTLKETITEAAKIAKRNTKRNDSLEDRKNYLVALLDFNIERSNIVICDNQKPCAGASFSVIELSDRFRVNYRCGYSRHNYAPCIEILK